MVAGRTAIHSILTALECISFNSDPLQALLIETAYQPIISSNMSDSRWLIPGETTTGSYRNLSHSTAIIDKLPLFRSPPVMFSSSSSMISLKSFTKEVRLSAKLWKWEPRAERERSQLPVTPVVAHSPVHLKVLPRTPYKSTTRQDDWVRQTSIEFGFAKLSDAADPRYLGVLGHDDRVLNYLQGRWKLDLVQIERAFNFPSSANIIHNVLGFPVFRARMPISRKLKNALVDATATS